jgi:hypothetical protein
MRHITDEELQNLGLCSALRAFEKGGISHATSTVTQSLDCSVLIKKAVPFNRLLRLTR